MKILLLVLLYFIAGLITHCITYKYNLMKYKEENECTYGLTILIWPMMPLMLAAYTVSNSIGYCISYLNDYLDKE